MTQLTAHANATHVDRATALAPVPGRPGEFAVELERGHRPYAVLGDGWLTGAFGVEDSGGGLAVEHGVIAEQDGTLVAESFQTRLTAED